TRSIALTTASGARHRAGFAHFRGGAIYNVKIPRAQEILGEERVVHTAEHLASAMFYLGAPLQEIPRAQLTANRQTPSKPHAVFHPVASAPDKTWPAEHFLKLAEHVQSAYGLEPIFIAAAEDDLSPFLGHRLVAGAKLSEVKDLIASASLFLGNDSGPAHMAAAFGLPVAVVFGNSDHRIWGPWKTTAEVLTSPDGISAIEPEQMMAALDRLGVKA
ncbi:MAG: glycosyltransferase family 9 protein, partial [bacterium]|nr:glycosyltransferase family 9 protein [bacterium]